LGRASLFHIRRDFCIFFDLEKKQPKNCSSSTQSFHRSHKQRARAFLLGGCNNTRRKISMADAAAAQAPLDRIVLRYLQKRGYKDAEKALLAEAGGCTYKSNPARPIAPGFNPLRLWARIAPRSVHARSNPRRRTYMPGCSHVFPPRDEVISWVQSLCFPKMHLVPLATPRRGSRA
jgi:hypothetical protein